MSVGLPSQVAALRKEVAAAKEEVLAEIDHVQTALGDVLHAIDTIRDCLRVVLKLGRHMHTQLQKMGATARTRR